MDLSCEERLSDSPFVERVWRSHSEQAAPFVSIAESHYNLVVTRYQGKTMITVRGPETKATSAYCPADAEFMGIQLKPGAFMPDFPAQMLMDRSDLNLPEAGDRTFWLHGSSWQFPNYDNAETFIDRLFRDGLLVQDSVVGSAVKGQLKDVSLRTVQRRFLQATGLTQTTIFQIERARHATILLMQGMSILDTIDCAGYFDQPHLTRALKRWTGQTPTQIISQKRLPMSLLYKTRPF